MDRTKKWHPSEQCSRRLLMNGSGLADIRRASLFCPEMTLHVPCPEDQGGSILAKVDMVTGEEQRATIVRRVLASRNLSSESIVVS